MKKTRSLSQIRGTMVSHHILVSPQNDVTRGGSPPPQATPLQLLLIITIII